MAKRKRGKRKGVIRHTPQSLRKVWDAVENSPQICPMPVTLAGQEVSSYEQLIQVHRENPRLVAQDIQVLMRRTLRRADIGVEKAESEKEDARAQMELLQRRVAMTQRLKQAKVPGLGKAQMDALAELEKGDGQTLLDALAAVAKIQEDRPEGYGVTAAEVENLIGKDAGDIERLLKLSGDLGLASTENRRWVFNEAITESQGEPEEKKEMPGDMTGRGIISIPTATVIHFSRLAQEEGLPLALDETALATFAPLARHLITGTELRETESRHYVRVDMIYGGRSLLVDDPNEVGEYGNQPLTSVVKDFLKPELPPLLQEVRAGWKDNDWIEQLPSGEWRWLRSMDDIDRTLSSWELKSLEVTEIKCDFPLRQFGLLVEAGRSAVPEDDGAEMPVHGGARSFGPIWRRQARLANLSREIGATVHESVRENAALRPDDPADLAEHLKPELGWSGRAVAASGVLSNLRECRTVAVDMDVSEGLPDWDTPEEAWQYADEAELPFPMTYFDFTSPGGYRPKISVKNKQGKDIELTLRAALCWKSEGYLTIAPFVWFAQAEADPERLDTRTDYDSPGAVHFGLSDKLMRTSAKGNLIDLEAELDPINHTVITTPDGVTGPSQVLMTGPLFDQPGWVDLFSDLQENREAEEVLTAEAMITAAAACRVLSVIYALDGTVNIELTEGEPSRPERREVERAQRKGKPAEISMTVRIHPTKQDERQPVDREVKREYSHAFYRRGHFAHYPIGTRMADRMAENAPSKLVNHPVKGLCRKIYRKPTIVGRIDADGEEREPIAKSYVWGKAKKRQPEPEDAAA